MKRLLFIAVIVATLAGLGFALYPALRTATRGAVDGPIIVISVDTLRADRLPAYGYTKIATPNIDTLATEGVLFENAWAHSPQTLPSHASILTGRLPFEHGVRDNIGFAVKPAERMLQHALRDRGYATGGFVSSYVLRRQVGIHQGFDVYDDQMPAAAPDRPLGEMQRPGMDTAAAAERWLGGLPSSKAFLFFHIYEPHTPYTPTYDADIEQADRIVGRLLSALRARGMYDDATIVLLSDHGEGLGDHGEEEHGMFLYRETMRVPLVIKMPGGRHGGRRVSAPVQHIDLLATILELAGGSAVRGSGVRETSRGRSLVPAIEGTAALAPASIYAEALSPRYHFGWSELYALTDDRYRLIRAPRDELFDLSVDPSESTSIAGERPQVRTAMRRALDAIIANAPVSAPSAVSGSDREKLAALGYVGTQSGAPLDAPGDTLADPKDKIGVLRKYRRATQLAGEGRHAEAIEAYRELLREDAEMADVWLQLAGVYEKRGMIPASLSAYQEVIKRKPKDPAALTGAASALIQMRRFDEARTHAELAVDVAPAIAHELLARLALQRGDAAAARSHAKLATAADPTLPMPAFVEGLIAYTAGDFAAAASHLGQASQALNARTERVADVNYLLGDSLARLERYPEAEAAFKAELAVFPAHLRARAGLAMLYAATGRAGQAEAAVEEITRISPTPEGFAMAAQLWTMFGRPEKAATALARRDRR